MFVAVYKKIDVKGTIETWLMQVDTDNCKGKCMLCMNIFPLSNIGESSGNYVLGQETYKCCKTIADDRISNSYF